MKFEIKNELDKNQSEGTLRLRIWEESGDLLIGVIHPRTGMSDSFLRINENGVTRRPLLQTGKDVFNSLKMPLDGDYVAIGRN